MSVIEKYIIIALAALLVIVSGLYLWQRITVVKQKCQIDSLTVANKDLQGQVADYKNNVLAAKLAQIEAQKIADETSGLLAEAQKINSTCVLGRDDEKVISDITSYFNVGGLLQPVSTGNSKTSGKNVSKAGTSDINRPHWTIKQIAINYGLIAKYAVGLERVTVSCYENH
jgi:hypothetical protein